MFRQDQSSGAADVFSPTHHPSGYLVRDRLRLSHHHTLAATKPLTPSSRARPDHSLSLPAHGPTRPGPTARSPDTTVPSSSQHSSHLSRSQLPAPGGSPRIPLFPPSHRALALSIMATRAQ